MNYFKRRSSLDFSTRNTSFNDSQEEGGLNQGLQTDEISYVFTSHPTSIFFDKKPTLLTETAKYAQGTDFFIYDIYREKDSLFLKTTKKLERWPGSDEDRNAQAKKGTQTYAFLKYLAAELAGYKMIIGTKDKALFDDIQQLLLQIESFCKTIEQQFNKHEKTKNKNDEIDLDKFFRNNDVFKSIGLRTQNISQRISNFAEQKKDWKLKKIINLFGFCGMKAQYRIASADTESKEGIDKIKKRLEEIEITKKYFRVDESKETLTTKELFKCSVSTIIIAECESEKQLKTVRDLLPEFGLKDDITVISLIEERKEDHIVEELVGVKVSQEQQDLFRKKILEIRGIKDRNDFKNRLEEFIDDFVNQVMSAGSDSVATSTKVGALLLKIEIQLKLLKYLEELGIYNLDLTDEQIEIITNHVVTFFDGIGSTVNRSKIDPETTVLGKMNYKITVQGQEYYQFMRDSEYRNRYILNKLSSTRFNDPSILTQSKKILSEIYENLSKKQIKFRTRDDYTNLFHVEKLISLLNLHSESGSRSKWVEKLIIEALRAISKSLIYETTGFHPEIKFWHEELLRYNLSENLGSADEMKSWSNELLKLEKENDTIIKKQITEDKNSIDDFEKNPLTIPQNDNTANESFTENSMLESTNDTEPKSTKKETIKKKSGNVLKLMLDNIEDPFIKDYINYLAAIHQLASPARASQWIEDKTTKNNFTKDYFALGKFLNLCLKKIKQNAKNKKLETEEIKNDENEKKTELEKFKKHLNQLGFHDKLFLPIKSADDNGRMVDLRFALNRMDYQDAESFCNDMNYHHENIYTQNPKELLERKLEVTKSLGEVSKDLAFLRKVKNQAQQEQQTHLNDKIREEFNQFVQKYKQGQLQQPTQSMINLENIENQNQPKIKDIERELLQKRTILQEERDNLNYIGEHHEIRGVG